MRAKFTVQGINRKEGDTANGKHWVRFGLFDGERWFNFFGADWNADLQQVQEGDVVEIFYKVEKYKGREQYVVVADDDPAVAAEKEIEGVRDEVKQLRERVEILEAQIEEISGFNPEDVGGQDER